MERYVEADLGLLRAGLAAVEDIADPVERALGFARYYERWADRAGARGLGLPLHRGAHRAGPAARDPCTTRCCARSRPGATRWPPSSRPRSPPSTSAVADVPDAHELADHLFATFEGGYLLCRSLRSPEPMRAQLRVFRQLLESLLA